MTLPLPVRTAVLEVVRRLRNPERECAKYIAATAAVITSILSQGYTLSKLWAWFLVPLGAPVISTATAIGVGLLARLLIQTSSSGGGKIQDKTESALWQKLIGEGVGGPILTLGFGWIVKLFL